MTFAIAPVEEAVTKDATAEQFGDIPASLLDKAKGRANEVFSGFEFGGILPSDRQYGLTSFTPRHVLGAGTITFTQTFNDPGSWTDIFNYSVPEDQIHGFAGFRFIEPQLLFTELRIELGDNLLPRVNIEEAEGFRDGFDVMLNQDPGEELVVPEENRILVRGLQKRGTGSQDQTVVPFGFILFKNKDDFITEADEPSA